MLGLSDFAGAVRREKAEDFTFVRGKENIRYGFNRINPFAQMLPTIAWFIDFLSILTPRAFPIEASRLR